MEEEKKLPFEELCREAFETAQSIYIKAKF
jgi:hypothetical protein